MSIRRIGILGGAFDPTEFDAAEMTELMQAPRLSGW